MERLTKKVKIYSNEHQAWWKPNYCGYTRDESKAGVFEIEDVYKNYGTNQITFDTNKEDYFVEVIGLTESEQLAKYKHLEEQIGCPIDVVFKAINCGIAYELKNGLIESEPFAELTECGYGYILCIGESTRRIVENGEFQLKDYKKTWWLKEDRSE